MLTKKTFLAAFAAGLMVFGAQGALANTEGAELMDAGNDVVYGKRRVRHGESAVKLSTANCSIACCPRSRTSRFRRMSATFA